MQTIICRAKQSINLTKHTHDEVGQLERTREFSAARSIDNFVFMQANHYKLPVSYIETM